MVRIALSLRLLRVLGNGIPILQRLPVLPAIQRAGRLPDSRQGLAQESLA